MRVAFAGTPSFALPVLAALRAHHEVVGVLTQPDRPSGRGRKVVPGAVSQAALEARLPVLQPPTLTSEAVQSELRDWHPQVLIVVAYGLLLPREVLEMPPLGCINVHASLLPRWRGAAPIQRALLAGDAETGVTIMQMEEGLDTGPILLQRRLLIRPDHTGRTLQEELAALGADALIQALEALRDGSVVPRPQPAEGVTYAPKIRKAEARIDWDSDAAAIERQLRALTPWPVAETRMDGEPLRIFCGHVAHCEGPQADSPGDRHRDLQKDAAKMAASGSILAIREGIIVKCGSGCLALTRVQRPGRRPVTGREYAQSSGLIGRRFE